MTSSTETSSPLNFSVLSSQVDPSFWFTLSTLKLNTWKLDASPRVTTGIYSTPIRSTSTGDGIIEFNAGGFDGSMYVSFKVEELMVGFRMVMLFLAGGQ
jgi:hypothetical protein